MSLLCELIFRRLARCWLEQSAGEEYYILHMEFASIQPPMVNVWHY